jgi:hypothetical protein
LRTAGVVLGTLGTGKLLVACANDGADLSGNPTWNLVRASFPELLVGEQQRFAFALTTIENEPIDEPSIEVYTRDPGGDITGGPYDVERFGHGALPLTVYLTHVDAPDPGPLEIVAVAGNDFGVTAVQVVRPEDSVVPTPGAEAIASKTPTPEDPMDFEEICTREPDCPLHDRSLDDLLTAGRPLLVMFATPAYCQTAVCGPAVDTFVDVSDARDWGDLAFLHVEIFTDAAVTIAPPVLDWGLPSEPWLFAIDAGGTIVDRLDGPMIAEELTRLAERFV